MANADTGVGRCDSDPESVARDGAIVLSLFLEISADCVVLSVPLARVWWPHIDWVSRSVRAQRSGAEDLKKKKMNKIYGIHNWTTSRRKTRDKVNKCLSLAPCFSRDMKMVYSAPTTFRRFSWLCCVGYVFPMRCSSELCCRNWGTDRSDKCSP